MNWTIHFLIHAPTFNNQPSSICKTFFLTQAPYFYPILILQQWQHIFYFR